MAFQDQFSWQEYGNTNPIAVMSERMCDLLLSFPSSAIGGVPWQTLAQKYEDRYATRLDPAVMGQESAVGMAMSLLPSVIRFIDISDVDNPIVAAQDPIVMVPHPGALGSWPSLYQALCNVVLNHGAPDGEPRQDETGCGLLLSQLKPLLRVHWHSGFEEGCLGCFSDDGKFVRLWKLKHLVQAVIRWRDLRVMWCMTTGSMPSIVDEALIPTLELVQSKQHSDLVLRCMPNGVVLHHVPGSIVSKVYPGARPSPELACEMRSFSRNQSSRKVHNSAKLSGKPAFVTPESFRPSGNSARQDTPHPATVSQPALSDLEKEATKLRSENEELRNKNQILEEKVELLSSQKKMPEVEVPLKTPMVALPPFVKVQEGAIEESSPSPASVGSTRASEHLSMDFQTTDEPMFIGDEDDVRGRSLKVESLDPEVSKRWAKFIPKGIVQSARARFEFKSDDGPYTEEILGFDIKSA